MNKFYADMLKKVAKAEESNIEATAQTAPAPAKRKRAPKAAPVAAPAPKPAPKPRTRKPAAPKAPVAAPAPKPAPKPRTRKPAAPKAPVSGPTPAGTPAPAPTSSELPNLDDLMESAPAQSTPTPAAPAEAGTPPETAGTPAGTDAGSPPAPAGTTPEAPATEAPAPNTPQSLAEQAYKKFQQTIQRQANQLNPYISRANRWIIQVNQASAKDPKLANDPRVRSYYDRISAILQVQKALTQMLTASAYSNSMMTKLALWNELNQKYNPWAGPQNSINSVVDMGGKQKGLFGIGYKPLWTEADAIIKQTSGIFKVLMDVVKYQENIISKHPETYNKFMPQAQAVYQAINQVVSSEGTGFQSMNYAPINTPASPAASPAAPSAAKPIKDVNDLTQLINTNQRGTFQLGDKTITIANYYSNVLQKLAQTPPRKTVTGWKDVTVVGSHGQPLQRGAKIQIQKGSNYAYTIYATQVMSDGSVGTQVEVTSMYKATSSMSEFKVNMPGHIIAPLIDGVETRLTFKPKTGAVPPYDALPPFYLNVKSVAEEGQTGFEFQGYKKLYEIVAPYIDEFGKHANTIMEWTRQFEIANSGNKAWLNSDYYKVTYQEAKRLQPAIQNLMGLFQELVTMSSRANSQYKVYKTAIGLPYMWNGLKDKMFGDNKDASIPQAKNFVRQNSKAVRQAIEQVRVSITKNLFPQLNGLRNEFQQNPSFAGVVPHIQRILSALLMITQTSTQMGADMPGGNATSMGIDQEKNKGNYKGTIDLNQPGAMIRGSDGKSYVSYDVLRERFPSMFASNKENIKQTASKGVQSPKKIKKAWNFKTGK